MPEPETPVTAVRTQSGTSTERSSRLCRLIPRRCSQPWVSRCVRAARSARPKRWRPVMEPRRGFRVQIARRGAVHAFYEETIVKGGQFCLEMEMDRIVIDGATPS